MTLVHKRKRLTTVLVYFCVHNTVVVQVVQVLACVEGLRDDDDDGVAISVVCPTRERGPYARQQLNYLCTCTRYYPLL